MSKVDLSVEIPPLPAGWQGTPSDLLEFIAENAIFSLDGTLPAGQIGGARPTQDVGIWYGTTSIESFQNGKYRPISDVPIAAVTAWAGTTGTPPDNYLFCDGSNILRATYTDLFSAIGTSYNLPTDSDATQFRLPDYRGRHPVGVGVGDYASQGVTGLMREIVMAQTSGFEWLRNSGAPAPGAPSSAKVINANNYVGSNQVTETFPPRIGQQFIIRYR